MNGLITNIQRFCLHDGPGIRTTVFLKGCPLECVWCQNPETIKSHSEVIKENRKCIECKNCINQCKKKCFEYKDNTIKYNSSFCDQCWECVDNCPTESLQRDSRLYSTDEVINIIMKDNEFYKVSDGGITLSGGEPLYQSRFCIDILKKAKKLKLHTAVDTSGYMSIDVLKEALPYIDLFLYDIKIFDEKEHKKYTTVSNTLILSNFKYICEQNKNITVRVPLIPGITDSEKNLNDIKLFIENYRNTIKIEQVLFNRLAQYKYDNCGKEYLKKKSLH